jgi:hypothetical protein
MISAKPHQSHARTQDRLSDVEGARNALRLWLACGYLILAGTQSVTSPATQAEPQSARASPPSVRETAPPPEAQRLPRISPDYLQVVIPPNLAPLNLAIQEPGIEYQLRVSGARGQPLELRQLHPHIRFPLREWKELLRTNRGGTLCWNIAVRNPAGEWMHYAPFKNRVAEEEIDPCILYRRLRPLFSYYKHLGIFQRNLETFEEKPVLRNDTFEHGCMNCHTFMQGAPDRFAIDFRTRSGAPTLLIDSNRISRIDTKMGYLSWHPNGKLLAFSANTITQFFHLAGPANRDIYDPGADLNIFHVDDRRVEKPAAIAMPNRSENWPCWAADGRHLYYSSAPTVDFHDVRSFRYDLLRIPYDPDQNRWGKPETLFSGAEHRLSAHQPRASPDGRYLVFTVSDSGSFPVFRSNSDLFLLRLDTRRLEPLPINSNQADTWHCWSSNGRWLVFGSKRLDGVFTRLLITHVDPAARFSRPLLLPQEDPTYYDTCLDNFNLPELVRGPVQVSEEELARAVNTPANRIGPTGRESPDPNRAPDRSTISEYPYP